MKMETVYQNSWEMAKTTFRGNLIAINTHIKEKDFK